MTKISRRHKIVSLYQGNYGAELGALADKVMAAKRVEVAAAVTAQPTTSPDGEPAGPPRRAGQKPEAVVLEESIRLAIDYDKMLTEAEETAEKITVWAISHDEWSQLADEHPPREDVPADPENGIAAKAFQDDKDRGVNTKTFPPMLLKASLVEPDGATSLEDRIIRGGKILDDLDLSRVQYVELETAAWNVNVEGDGIPKAFSLVSYLTNGSGDGSKAQDDSE